MFWSCCGDGFLLFPDEKDDNRFDIFHQTSNFPIFKKPLKLHLKQEMVLINLSGEGMTMTIIDGVLHESGSSDMRQVIACSPSVMNIR